MASIVSETVPEHCFCSKCRNVIPSKAYQCVKANVVCKTCVEENSSCYICNSTYNGAPVRNEALEGILEIMRFPCKFKHKGCQSQLKRQEIAAHQYNCLFGHCVCKSLGIRCDVDITFGNQRDLLNHLTWAHSAVNVECTASMHIHMAISKLCKDMGTKSKQPFVKPIIMTTVDSNVKILLVISVTCRESSILLRVMVVVVPLEVDLKTEEVYVNVEIQPLTSLIKKTISWKQKALHIGTIRDWSMKNALTIYSCEPWKSFSPTDLLEFHCSFDKCCLFGKEDVHPAQMVDLTRDFFWFKPGKLSSHNSLKISPSTNASRQSVPLQSREAVLSKSKGFVFNITDPFPTYSFAAKSDDIRKIPTDATGFDFKLIKNTEQTASWMNKNPACTPFAKNNSHPVSVAEDSIVPPTEFMDSESSSLQTLESLRRCLPPGPPNS